MGVGEALDEGLQHQHRRHIAHEIGEDRRDRGQHGRLVEVKALGLGQELRRQDGGLHAAHHDEEPGEEQQQGPVDLAIDPLGLEAPRQQQQRAGGDRHLGRGLAGEEQGDGGQA